MKNKQGFTLMELAIVLAVLAIIAAILIPTFLTTTDRARLRSDIQSAHVINNAVELYRVEQGRSPGTDIEAVLNALHDAGYLRTAAEATRPQTAGAVWAIEDGRVVLNITGATGGGVQRAADNLSTEERLFIAGNADQ